MSEEPTAEDATVIVDLEPTAEDATVLIVDLPLDPRGAVTEEPPLIIDHVPSPPITLVPTLPRTRRELESERQEMENLRKQLADERDRISRRYHSTCLKRKKKKL